MNKESAWGWFMISFSGFANWFNQASPLEIMSFIGMVIGALGVVHSGWVRHQKLKLDRHHMVVKAESNENSLHE